MPVRKSSYSGNLRQNKKRRTGEQRTGSYKTISILIGLIVLILGGFFFANSPLTDVERVVVQGNTRTDYNTILNSAQVTIGQPMYDVGVDVIKARILDIGTVRSVDIERRVFSGDLIISITERSPFAVVPGETGYILIDSDGIQLEIVNEIPENYPVLSAESSDGVLGTPVSNNIGGFVNLWTELSANNKELLENYQVNENGGMVADLKSGGSVEFGLGEDIAEKSLDLEAILQKVDLTCLAAIDVQVPSFPTVTRLENCPDGDIRSLDTEPAPSNDP